MNGPDVPSSGTPPTGGDPGFDAVIEDILAGRLGHEPEDEMSLVGLVDALRAPGSDEELGDVDAAASAFVTARATGTPAVVVPLAPRRTGRAVVAVAAVVGGLLLVGGTAAATTGSLPSGLQDAVHQVLPFVPSSSPEASTASPGTGGGTSGGTSAGGTAAGGSSRGSAASSAGSGQGGVVVALPTDAPNRGGQCTAYFNRAAAAMDSTSYERLLLAAQKAGVTVDQWCDTFAPGSRPGAGKPSAKPTGSAANNGNGNGNGNGATNGNNGNGNGNGIGNGNGNQPTQGAGATNGNGSTKGAGNAPARPSATP